ncbi:MAG: Mur ligase domain-containing protein, partial [Bacteroidota bacterium]|nr:Mur ligase domain-containing protein [Bacteroidota bacterium]MDX5431699.1 Mur ligase domain-containing protein [Bacteroidota bacterium]MDX5470414.1 Mur ligase domain-containing protein [Bacteroidota bacterium]
MSALARYYHATGYLVAGYDKTPSPLIEELINSGIEVVFEEGVAAIPAAIQSLNPGEVMWVYTPAIPKDHAQLNWLKDQGITPLKRAQVLGQITRGRQTLAVAGTHGKTTTSSLLAHLLHAGGVDCTAFLGGISTNFGTNYIEAKNVHAAPVVVEADEFDRSFLQLQPNMAIVTSTDADHLDIYGEAADFRKGFEEFTSLIPKDGMLIQKKGLGLPCSGENLQYAVELETDYFAAEVRIENGHYRFNLETPTGMVPDLSLGLPGRHNMENAVAASAIALRMGVSQDDLRKGLASFKGVKRRFERIINREDCIYIDDYAHHPEE